MSLNWSQTTRTGPAGHWRRHRPGNVEIRDQILIDPISFHRSQSCVSGRAGTWLGYLPGEHINQTSHRHCPTGSPQALQISARSSNPTYVIQSAKEPRERCYTTTTDRRKSYHGVSLPVEGRAPVARPCNYDLFFLGQFFKINPGVINLSVCRPQAFREGIS